MVEKRKIEEPSQDELNSSKKIKMLEEEVLKLKKRDEDAQVMTQNMNEKMMDRIAKAEKEKEESEKKIRMINHLNKYKFIEVGNKLWDETKKEIVSEGYKTRDISKIIQNAILSDENVEEKEFLIKCIQYKTWRLYYNCSDIKYIFKRLPKQKNLPVKPKV